MADQKPFGSWSDPTKPTADPPIQEYANKVRFYAQQAVGNQTGEFKKYDVTLCISQVVAGMNYVVKVDTGNGDDKFAHVQFFVSLCPRHVDFTAAKTAKKSDPLKPIKD